MRRIIQKTNFAFLGTEVALDLSVHRNWAYLCRFLLTANIRNKRIALDSLGSRIQTTPETTVLWFQNRRTEDNGRELKENRAELKRTRQNWTKLHKKRALLGTLLCNFPLCTKYKDFNIFKQQSESLQTIECNQFLERLAWCSRKGNWQITTRALLSTFYVLHLKD